MKSFRKALAIAIVLAQTAFVPGLGIMAASAQNLGRGNVGVQGNTGTRGVSPVNVNSGIGGGNLGSFSSRANLSGSVIGIDAGPTVRPSIEGRVGEIGRLAPVEGLTLESERVAPNAGPSDQAAAQVLGRAAETAGVQEFMSFIGNGAESQIAGPTETNGAEMGAQVYKGRIQFDGANRKASDSLVPAMGVDAGPSETELTPAQPQAQADGSRAVPPAGPSGTSSEGKSGPSKWQTLTDLLVIGGVSSLTHGLAHQLGGADHGSAALISLYATTVLVSSIRYSQDFVELLGKKEWGGAAKAGAAAVMAGLLAPVALAVDAWQQLVVPIAKNIWKAVKEVAKFIRDLAIDAWNLVKRAAKAVWTFVKDVANAVWEGLKAVGRFIRDLVSDLWTAIKNAAEAVWNLVKDLANAAWEAIKDIASWVADVLEGFYTHVLTPIGHALRGLSAAAIAGLAAALVVVLPFLGSMGMNFIVKPLAQLFDRTGKWPKAFSIPAALVVTAGVVLAAISLPVLQGLAAAAMLTVGGSMLIGFFGGAWTALVEGYRSGFIAGISKGVGQAYSVATGSYNRAKANYSSWRMNLQK